VKRPFVDLFANIDAFLALTRSRFAAGRFDLAPRFGFEPFFAAVALFLDCFFAFFAIEIPLQLMVRRSTPLSAKRVPTLRESLN
jgi:hypothetical protein